MLLLGCCNGWSIAAAAGQIVAALGSVWAVYAAYSNANKARRIDIAPQRTTIFRLCSLLVDRVEDAVVQYSNKKVLTKCEIRAVMQDWMLSIERDERFLYLKRLNILSSSNSGIAIGCYRDLMPQIQVVLSDVPYYFSTAVSDNVLGFLRFFEDCEPWIPDVMNEMDQQKELGQSEADVTDALHSMIRNMNEALEAMKKDLKIG